MRTELETTRAFRTATGFALALLLGACGGGTRPPTGGSSPSPSPTIPPPRVVSEGSDTLDVGFIGSTTPFTTTLTGHIDVTVNWTLATNDVDVALTRGACTAQQFIDDQCTIATLSESVTDKPEHIRLASAAPGTYTIILANAGPGDESLSWQAVHTPTVASGSAGTDSEKGSVLPVKMRGYRGGVTLR